MKERQSSVNLIVPATKKFLMSCFAFGFSFPLYRCFLMIWFFGVLFNQNSDALAADSKIARKKTLAQVQTRSAVHSPAPPKKNSPWKTLLEIEYATNQYKSEDVQKQTSISLVLAPQYVFSESVSFSLFQIVSQEQTKQRNSSISNTLITGRYKSLSWGDRGDLRHELTGIAPVNQLAKERDRFQGGLRVGNGIQNAWGFFFVKYLFSVTRNFHEFSLNQEGSPNLQYSLGHRIDVEFTLSESFKLSFVGAYRTGYTYRDFQRSNYLTESRLDFSLAEGAGIFLGLSTDAPVLKSNGRESNIQFFDENLGQVQTGMSFSF